MLEGFKIGSGIGVGLIVGICGICCIITILFFGLSVLTYTTTSGNPTGPTAAVTVAGSDASGGAGTAMVAEESRSEGPKTYKFNEPVVVGNLQYTFKDYSLKQEIGQYIGDTLMGSKANGVYLIVEVEIKNIGNKAEYLSSSNIKVVDDQKREFETDFSSQIYLSTDPDFKNSKQMLFDKLNPGLTQKGYLVFDIPEDIKGGIQVVDNYVLPSETAWVSWQ